VKLLSLSALFAVLLVSALALAQQPAPVQPLPPVPASVQQAPIAAAPAYASPVQTNSVQPDTSGERLKQLERSAAELEQAGQKEQAAAARQQARAERQALRNHIDGVQAEINRLRSLVGPAEQVLVHLKVFEVSVTKLKKAGVDITKLHGNTATTTGDDKKTGAAAFAIASDTDEILRLLEKLRTDGQVKMLSEPTLVAISGQQAAFHSGGEVAIPTTTKDGTSQTNYCPYGTRLEFSPQVLGDSHVRLTLHGCVSELDYARATRINDVTVPGINSRDFSLAVEMLTGRTLIISGLTRSRVEATNSGVPWVSEIPYAGAAFRKVKEEHNEIETFVLITPEIVEGPAATVPIGRSSPTPPKVKRIF
jgi:Flp pilus assembly secretin CpaC